MVAASAARASYAAGDFPPADASPLEAALAYAALGWPVFPVAPDDSKAPLTAHGLKDATTDPATIRAWWARHPAALVAAPMGPATGLWALDSDPGSIDRETGEVRPSGEESIADLERRFGPLPATLTQRTPRGGLHRLFRWSGESVPSRAGDIAPSLDVRGVNSKGKASGSLILAPSRRPGAGAYQWQGDAPSIADAVPAPLWLVFLATFGIHDREQLAKHGIHGPDNLDADPRLWPTRLEKIRAADRAEKQRQWEASGASRAAGSLNAYFAKILEDELNGVARATSGRNKGLNLAALKLGGWADAAGWSADDLTDRLLGAAHASGYVAKDGERAARLTIASGLNAGLRNPKVPPPPKPRNDYGSGTMGRAFNDAAARDRAGRGGPKADAAGKASQKPGDGQQSEGASIPPDSDDPRSPAAAAAAIAADDEVFSEAIVAEAFVARYQDLTRYDHTAKTWMVWDGARWKPDVTRICYNWASQLAIGLAATQTATVRKSAGRAGFASGVEQLASAFQSIAAHSTDPENPYWDPDPLLLGTPGGTVDLRTGELRKARPDERITKLAGAIPSTRADCPRWLAFLKESTGGDEALIDFLQTFCGYALTGLTVEHCLLFFHGDGGNGKGTFINIISKALGDYATVAAMSTLIDSGRELHSEELASLQGARLVTASETDEGRAWAEARVKSITGGDTIRARRLYENSFAYRPTYKLAIIGNHQPALRNPDDAMRRRFLMVPFNQKPAVKDLHLEDKLTAELPGILRWMIAGCLKWQATELPRPAAVLQATRDYFEDQDLHGAWLEDRCDVGSPDYWEPSAQLFDDYRQWMKANGEPEGNQRGFNKKMLRAGYARPIQKKGIDGKGTKQFQGIRLKVKGRRYDD